MNTYDLSVVIPARHEEFLNRTIADILQHRRGRTQVIVGLDGEWPLEPIETHPDVVILYYPESIGQRAIINQCVRLSRAPYIMKVDAHCAFDEGFDVKLLKLMQPDITMVPVMRNLHVFDWVCPNGHRRYQGPSGPCKECGAPTTKDVVWIAKTNPQATCYRFDRSMHFQYWNEHGRRQSGELTETLSLQGSCFLVERQRFLDLDLCSEDFQSWGQQGVEVACKSWLSGGRVLVNRTTWYAHMFRTQGGDFGFPYPLSQRDVDKNRELSREMFERGRWPGAKYSFPWLISKFNPPDWETQAPTRGVLYYSDNCLNMQPARSCRKHIADSQLPVTSVTLKPTKFGRNIWLRGRARGYKTMFEQIEAGLDAMTEDVVYFAEHDTLYHPDHFAFVPPDRHTFYYNGNYWFLRLQDGFAIHYNVPPLSGLVAYREPLLTHFRERNAMIAEKGFGLWMGFEPMTHGRVKWQHQYKFEVFMPPCPNVDLAHGSNQTWKRWSKSQFRRKPTFWEESTIAAIPGWPELHVLLSPFCSTSDEPRPARVASQS